MTIQRYRAADFRVQDVIRYKLALWTIERVEVPADDFDGWPENWSDYQREGARFLHVVGETGEQARITCPRFSPPGQIETIATEEDEGHWPVCQGCGEAWTCTHHSVSVKAKFAADGAIKRAVREFENPWPCAWCKRFQRERRFSTERGLKTHIRLCKSNPNNWDLDERLPMFDEKIRFKGSGLTRAFPNEQQVEFRRIADKVRERALQGDLPDDFCMLFAS